MTPYYSESGITIYHGRAEAVLPMLAFGAIVSDPPYGMDYKPLRGADGSKRWRGGVQGDDQPFDPSLLLNVPCVLWGANWYSNRLPGHGGWLVWNKTCEHRKSGFIASDCELAFASEATRTFRFDLQWGGEARNGEPFYHPTQKPVALMAWRLGFVPADALICDPYMGGGPTLVAAKLAGRRAVGIEINERYCETAANRLRQGVLFGTEGAA
jgi:site-specific DNA-methyltransferase (adenine-specific)